MVMRTSLIVDLQKFVQNIRKVKARIPEGVKLLAVVKADAYGHGAVALSNIAHEEGVDYFGVATAAEAIELREAGIRTPILLLGEPTDWERIKPVIYYDITLMVYSEEFLAELLKVSESYKKKVKVHLKVDTGMTRLGVKADDVVAFAKKILANPFLELEGVATHLADSDNEDVSYSKKQVEIFERVIFELSKEGIDIPIKHASNSAGIINPISPFFDMVRAGIDLYKGIMSFTAKVLYVREIEPGEHVGYCLTYKSEQKMRIAVISVGYADGYSRALSNKGRVLLHGVACPIVGNICMDMMMVAIPVDLEVKVGDDAVLIGSQDGEEITVNEIAQLIGTIEYEVMTSIGKRVARIYRS